MCPSLFQEKKYFCGPIELMLQEGRKNDVLRPELTSQLGLRASSRTGRQEDPLDNRMGEIDWDSQPKTNLELRRVCLEDLR